MYDHAVEKNMMRWDRSAAGYSELVHSEKAMRRVLDDPKSSFHHAVWNILKGAIPCFEGLTVCVPSSGDNHAVFSFAMLGAQVLSCDISAKQLEYAERVSSGFEWGKRIRYLQADTMSLNGVPDDTFDLVYTSNGVHVWIDRLDSMYRSIFRVLKAGGLSMMYDIHPMTRPFDDDLKIIKPYDMTGPFEDSEEVTFTWRLMDIMNAMISSGLSIRHVEELSPEKDYERPFRLPLKDALNGVKVTAGEVDRMYDWRVTPAMALPGWLSILAEKPAK